MKDLDSAQKGTTGDPGKDQAVEVWAGDEGPDVASEGGPKVGPG